jgi:hypothetical protein
LAKEQESKAEALEKAAKEEAERKKAEQHISDLKKELAEVKQETKMHE